MRLNRDNYLNIKFDAQKGLKFKWNFKDVTGGEKFFRHIFVLLNIKSEEIISFLEAMYKKMKLGDIFCCIYVRDDGEVIIGSFIQKTLLSKFQISKYLNRQSDKVINDQQKDIILQLLSQQFTSSFNYLIVNFMMADDDKKDLYYSYVKKLRERENSYPYIFNLFGKQLKNIITYHTGINQFRRQSQNNLEVAQFYNQTVQSAVIPKAKITVQCLNGELNLFNQKYWKNIDFTTIQAEFFGVSAKLQQDGFLFVIANNQPQTVDLHLKITLQIIFFSRKKMESEKILHINYEFKRENCPTLQETKLTQYLAYKNIVLSQDPYSTNILVKVFKNHSSEKSNQAYQLNQKEKQEQI